MREGQGETVGLEPDPDTVGGVECGECKHWWEAAWAAKAQPRMSGFECPACGNMAGVLLKGTTRPYSPPAMAPAAVTQASSPECSCGHLASDHRELAGNQGLVGCRVIGCFCQGFVGRLRMDGRVKHIFADRAPPPGFKNVKIATEPGAVAWPRLRTYAPDTDAAPAPFTKPPPAVKPQWALFFVASDQMEWHFQREGAVDIAVCGRQMEAKPVLTLHYSGADSNPTCRVCSDIVAEQQRKAYAARMDELLAAVDREVRDASPDAIRVSASMDPLEAPGRAAMAAVLELRDAALDVEQRVRAEADRLRGTVDEAKAEAATAWAALRREQKDRGALTAAIARVLDAAKDAEDLRAGRRWIEVDPKVFDDLREAVTLPRLYTTRE